VASQVGGAHCDAYLDSEQENQIYISFFIGFWPVFGQSGPQERAQRPRLEKHYINQRTLARGINSEAPKN
jgi:hypothetical protein